MSTGRRARKARSSALDCFFEGLLLAAGARQAQCHVRQSRRHSRTSAERVAIFRTLNSLDRAVRRHSLDAEVDVKIMGYPMRGFRPDTMRYLFREIFLANEYAFPATVPDPVIVDCGANIGFSVLYFKRLHPRARIMAFEANPRAFRLLKHNVSNNHLEQVEPLPVALSDQDGEIPFFIDLEPGSLTASTRRDRGGEQQLMVKCERLSKTLASLDRVDLVKIDVEGSEWAILNDLITSGTLAKPERYIIEYHHQIAGEAPHFSQFLALFEQAGFRYQVAARIDQPDAFQDVLVHLVRL